MEDILAHPARRVGLHANSLCTDDDNQGGVHAVSIRGRVSSHVSTDKAIPFPPHLP